jgi:hypothetical protein
MNAMQLTQRQIRYGFEHPINNSAGVREVIELSEYRGEKKLTINCTQLGDSLTPQFASAREKKRILSEWCDYLKAKPASFTELGFGTRMPQELLEAVCRQRKLVKLDIKWGAYEDLSPLEQLQDLRLLHLGSGARVTSILPLAKLPSLVALSVENFQKVTDYAPLASQKKLESLSIEGDGLGPQFIQVDSLDFLRRMAQLRFFRLFTARLRSKDYRPILSLRNLEYLGLRPAREVKALYEDLVCLPRLKWGLLPEKPELYRPASASP